ncbi:MAG: Kelch repeat-containing protein [Polyangiales bacterium]
MKRALLLLSCIVGCARVWGFEEPTLDAGPPAIVREPCFENGKSEIETCDGGQRSRICNPDGWSSFSACAAAGWRDLPPAPIAGRIWHSTVWTGEELIVWGGRGPDEAYADGAAYDPVKNSWRVLAPAPLGARIDHAAVWTGSQMLVWGGRNDPTVGTTYFADGATYDPRTNTWERLPGSPMSNRARVAAVWSTTTREVLLWGGIYEFDFNSNDGAAFDPVTRKWTYLPNTAATPRAATASFWDGARMVVVAGECKQSTKGPCNDAWAYDPSTNLWDSLGAAPKTFATDEHYSSADRGSVMALFGGDVLAKRVGNGVLFDAHTKGWADIPAPTTELGPTPERDFATVWWAEGKLAVYGGFVTAGFDDHLATYDPKAKTWTAMPSPGLGPRMAASATRSHDDVFVFGGRREGDGGAFFAHLADGRIYRLATPGE